MEGISKAVLLGVVKTINQDIKESQGSSSWQVHVEVGDEYEEGDPLLVAVVDKAKGGDIVSSLRRMDDKLHVMSYLKETLSKSGGEGGIVILNHNFLLVEIRHLRIGLGKRWKGLFISEKVISG